MNYASDEDDHRLSMPGAKITTHRVLEDALDAPAGPRYAGIRAALDLDPDSGVARVFEVTAGGFPGRPIFREMTYHDGILPRFKLTMDEDNQVQVAIYCPEGPGLVRYDLSQITTLCDLAKKAANSAVTSNENAQLAIKHARETLAICHDLEAENTRLKAEVEHLRKLLRDRHPEPPAS